MKKEEREVLAHLGRLIATEEAIGPVGGMIEALRAAKGWTRYRLAKKAAMTASQLKDIETGKNKNPGIETLRRITDALGTDLNRILFTTTFSTPSELQSHVVRDEDHDRPRPEHAILVPIRGVAVGGSPQEATEVQGEDYSLLHHLYKPGRFVIRLFGDSMHPTYWSNDLLLVDPKEKVKNGDIALVRVDNESTVKRIFFEKGRRIQLLPDNRTHKAVIVESDQDFRIEGKVLKIVEGERP